MFETQKRVFENMHSSSIVHGVLWSYWCALIIKLFKILFKLYIFIKSCELLHNLKISINDLKKKVKCISKYLEINELDEIFFFSGF